MAMQKSNSEDLKLARKHLSDMRKSQVQAFESQFEQLKRFASEDAKGEDGPNKGYDSINEQFQKHDREVSNLSRKLKGLTDKMRKHVKNFEK
ncbi:hypothetical protein AAMO2058_000262100 [Amorphochlora amoebiformis]